jgi:hypothetical protein
MTARPRRVLVATAVAIVDAVLFVWLLYFGQAIADGAATRAPFWLAPAWRIFSFPGRYLYLLPALDHPFGFGEHEDLTLYMIAACNGLAWAGVTYLLMAVWTSRRRAGP